MKSVILKTTDGEKIYINPEHVSCIEGKDDENYCIVHIPTMSFGIAGHKHLIATILATEPTRPDKFVSYKDWDWEEVKNEL